MQQPPMPVRAVPVSLPLKCSQIWSKVADRDEVQTIEVAMTNVKLEKF